MGGGEGAEETHEKLGDGNRESQSRAKRARTFRSMPRLVRGACQFLFVVLVGLEDETTEPSRYMLADYWHWYLYQYRYEQRVS